MQNLNRILLGGIGLSALIASFVIKVDLHKKQEQQQRKVVEAVEKVYRNNPQITPKHCSEPLDFCDNNVFGMKAYYRNVRESQEHELLRIYTTFDSSLRMFTFFTGDYLRLKDTNFQFTAYAVDRNGNKSSEERFAWNKGNITKVNTTQ